MHPGEFFAIAYPRPPERTAFLLKSRAAVGAIRAASAGNDGPKAG